MDTERSYLIYKKQIFYHYGRDCDDYDVSDRWQVQGKEIGYWLTVCTIGGGSVGVVGGGLFKQKNIIFCIYTLNFTPHGECNASHLRKASAHQIG